MVGQKMIGQAAGTATPGAAAFAEVTAAATTRERVKFGLLFGSEDGADLVAGILGFLADCLVEGLAQLVNVFLTRSDDFFDLIVLLGRQTQFTVHAMLQRLQGLKAELAAAGARTTAGFLRAGDGHAGLVHQKAADDEAGGKNDESGKDDFPGAHGVSPICSEPLSIPASNAWPTASGRVTCCAREGRK